MNAYNFTERVRKVMMHAREEARALHHEYVGTEHILLGMLRDGGGVANAAIENLNVQPDAIRREILAVVKPGAPGSSRGPDLPYTSRAKKSLELAMTEAHEHHHAYVGTEHLLLGLMKEERGIAAQILAAAGLTITGVRAEVLRLLGDERFSDGVFHRQADLEAAITLVVEHPDGRIEARKFRRSGDAVTYLNGLEY